MEEIKIAISNDDQEAIDQLMDSHRVTNQLVVEGFRWHNEMVKQSTNNGSMTYQVILDEIDFLKNKGSLLACELGQLFKQRSDSLGLLLNQHKNLEKRPNHSHNTVEPSFLDIKL